MKIMVFDTETMGVTSQQLLNVGYTIIDLDLQTQQYKTLVERDYLVRKLYNNEFAMINDTFVGITKYEMYQHLIQEKRIIQRNLQQIMTTLKNDLKRHKVEYGYAYNCDFDIDKFAKNCESLGIENPIEDLQILDIWSYAVNYICNRKDYKEWALENNQLTATKFYISTSVETVVRYLTQNLDFVEDHTALSDVQHERNILIECLKRGCDITSAMEHKNIPSDKTFTKILRLNGQEIEVNYKKVYERNGVVTYK